MWVTTVEEVRRHLRMISVINGLHDLVCSHCLVHSLSACLLQNTLSLDSKLVMIDSRDIWKTRDTEKLIQTGVPFFDAHPSFNDGHAMSKCRMPCMKRSSSAGLTDGLAPEKRK